MSNQNGRDLKQIDPSNPKEPSSNISDEGISYKQKDAKWLNNNDEVVDKVFGFNENSELVNGRAAMIGFAMLILTELVFLGEPVTHSIFGIN